MNEKLLDLINGVGIMTELWVITYSSFKKQNLSDKEALMHTKELMAVLMDNFITSGGLQ